MTDANGRKGPPALEMMNVHAAYGKIEVLRGVTFSVPRGTVFALLGPNGGGKSTTLRVASGRMTPRSGCVHIGGHHVNGVSSAALTRAGVCTIPEGRGIFPNLTVSENLWVATNAAKGISAKDLQDRAFAAFPSLAERRTQTAGTLSGGEQQMLALSRALATDPLLLLLDEISMGLAPRIVADLYESVAHLAAQGVSLLIVEQSARTVLGVADTAAIMLHGRIQRIGTPTDIEAQLSEAYLGGVA
jgi:branched-chain amino acid transport system ATP-binding protein